MQKIRLKLPARAKVEAAEEFPKIQKTARRRSSSVNAVWHDHFANHWYEYPRNARTDSAQTPSIWLRGHWISAAGFAIGDKIDVEVSQGLITLRVRSKK